ncbi:MAG: tetratricopeptide repeat protein [bacterium]
MNEIETLQSQARDLYGTLEQPEKALALLLRALELDKNNVETLNLLAAVYYELDDIETAEDFHGNALDVCPNSVEALHGLAALANERGDHTQALKLTKFALDAAPLDPSTEFRENADYRQRLLAQVYIERATALWQQGNPADAHHILTITAPTACPLEEETFAEELEWLEEGAE